MRADEAEHRAVENSKAERESARRQSRFRMLMEDQFVCDSLGIMVIVPATRSDLRGEFAMSDDAFASSQTSRRFSVLSETEYARMHDTLMETARGRWFLDEYARRNRNADTTMVLEAVARIERVVAAEPMPAVPEAPDIRDDIRDVLQRARADLDARATSDAEDSLTPARRAARIIREIAYQMRACGNDPRICNILDAQLDAIDAGIQNPQADPDAHLRPVIEGLFAQVEAILGGPATGTDNAPAVQATHAAIADGLNEQGAVDEEDTAILARIAAEMATSDSDPDRDSFDEVPPPLVVQADKEERRDTLGEMLIARGIIQPRGDRDAAASQGARSS